jgi:photosystem II stability/assembly factor-like uncharacterized protein
MAKLDSGTNLLMVGTAKGAFVFSSKDGRRTWKSSGPHFAGNSIYMINYDRRNGVLICGIEGDQWGPRVALSHDMGKTWKNAKPPKFPKGSGVSVKRVWQIYPSTEDEPDTIYMGVDPAALFRSDDAGKTWKLNKSLFDHKTRPKWNPGAGGLCLHSILVDPEDPKNIHIGISAVGTLNSRDGGESWRFQNKDVLADFQPNKYPEYGQCVHKLAMNQEKPHMIYQQNHCGVYRSDDNGENWKDIRNNLPSRFGFPIAVDANDPKRVYNVPLVEAWNRVTVNDRFAVWMSDNSGKEWVPLGKGLPKPAFFTVLRDGMKSDKADPCGLYVGTTTGRLYASRNQGNSWIELGGGVLPPIFGISAA